MLSLAVAGALWIIPLTTLLVSGRFGAHDFTRVVGLALLATCALARASLMRRSPVSLRSFSSRIAVVLAVSAAVSTALAHHPWIALREVIVAAGLIVFAFAISDALTEQRLRGLLAVLAVTAFGYGLVVYVPLALAVRSGAAIYTFDLVVGYDNPRFLNHCQSVAIPLLVLTAVWRPERPLLRGVAWVAAVMACGILGLCSARASVLATLAAALMPLLLLGRRALRFSLALLLALAIGGLGMTYISWEWRRTFEEFTSIEALTQLNYRDYLIQRAIHAWWSAPWFGVGPMHFADVGNAVAAHPHNVYLQLLCEYGLFATALVLALLLQGAHALIRAAHVVPGGKPTGRDSNELAAAVIGMMAAVLTDAAFSGSFVMPLAQLWCAMAFGIAGWFCQSRGGDALAERVPQTRAWSSVVRWVICAALVLLAAQSLHELTTLPVPALLTPEQPEVLRGSAHRNPRFWEHGWF